MTVCLTGDVHHMSLETRDQEYMDRTELEAAIEYAEIAAEYDVPVTLFVTGKAAEEEPERVKRVAAMENVEIGGHNYWAFDTLVHKGWRGLTGSWNGPPKFQSWEISKTSAVFSNIGINIRSWRDHAYRNDKNTKELLKNMNFTHFSDPVEPNGAVRKEGRLTVVPINTPPDHEHVFHSFRTRDFVKKTGFEGPFGTRSVTGEEWVNWVERHIQSSSTIDTYTILAHPSCMSLTDDFQTLRRLCNIISDYSAKKISNIS